jgi:uncharacterized protein YbaP (TraB family)
LNLKPTSVVLASKTQWVFILFCFLGQLKEVNGQNTILWSVSDSTGKQPSYLLGTFHQVGNHFVDSIPIIKEKMLGSNIVFFESIGNTDSLREQLNRRKHQFTYQKYLRRKDVDCIEKWSENWQVPVSKLTPIELYIKLNQLYVLNICGTALTTDQFQHFDKYLLYLARQGNLDVRGLETDSAQTFDINALDSNYTWKRSRKEIHKLIQNIKSKNTESRTCLDAHSYMHFDLEYHFEQVCLDRNLIERNAFWMRSILPALEKNQVFIAIGLAHLYGQCGLIEQLRRNGYLVEEVHLR